MPRLILLGTDKKTRARRRAALTLGSPSFAAMGTTFTGDFSPDGMSWDAVSGAFVIDQYGKYIQYIQRYNSNTRLCYFIFSNNKGVSWSDNTGISGGEGFLVRGSMVYDSGRDCIHGLIVTTNAGDGGIIYRRYTITRDGSNNITAIARVAGVSVSLDSDGAAYEFPSIIMSDADTLVAAWTVRTTGPGGEIRACKCDISGDDDAGGTAANWVHIGVNSTTTIGGAPHTASYTVVFSQASNVFTYFSLLEMASGDLGWFYHSGPTPGAWRWRRSVRNAANTWNSLSTPATVSNMQVAGTDDGYTLKNQLSSKLGELDGVIFCAAPVWLSNAAGDTVRLFRIAANDTVTAATVYSAGGAHSYAPTCGLGVGRDRVQVAYIKTTTLYPYLQQFAPDDLSVVQEEDAEPMTETDCDIPVIVFTDDDGKLGVAFRQEGSPPQPGFYGTMSWE